MTIATRTWTGTLQRVTSAVDFDACQCTGSVCRCPAVVEIPIRTADGRTVLAKLTPDAAEDLARQLTFQAEMARAQS